MKALIILLTLSSALFISACNSNTTKESAGTESSEQSAPRPASNRY